MVRRGLPLALIAGLVVLAGCSGFLGLGGSAPGTAADGATEPTPSEDGPVTVTETAAVANAGANATRTPNGTTPATAVAGESAAGVVANGSLLPPGTTADGEVAAVALARAHAAALQNRSVTVTERYVERFADGRPRQQRLAVEYVEPGGHYYLLERQTGRSPVLLGYSTGWYEQWSNGSAAATALTVGGKVLYSRESPSQRNVRRFDRIRSLLSALDPRVVGTDRIDGTRVVVLAGRAATLPSAVPGGDLEGPRNVSFRALVDGDGLVRAYRLRFTATHEGEAVHVVESVRFTRLGSTTVPRPEWVDVALGTPGRLVVDRDTDDTGVGNDPPT